MAQRAEAAQHRRPLRSVELHRIGQKVQEDLLQAVRIDLDQGRRRPLDRQDDAVALGQSGHGGGRVGQYLPGIDALQVPLHPVPFHAPKIENLIQQPGQALALAKDDADEAPRPLRIEVRLVVQEFGEGTDRGHGRAQFVADVAEKVVLHLVQLGQFLVGGAQLLGRLAQFLRFALKRAAVFDGLLGFFQQRHHGIDAERFALGDAGNHLPGRDGADAAGELAFDDHLGRNAGMVGADDPERILAFQTLQPDQDILQNIIERVANMEAARHIGRWVDDGEWFAVLPVGPEQAALFPMPVPARFNRCRIKIFRQFTHHESR